MHSSALSPKAVILMTKIKRELILSGIKADVVAETGWDYDRIDDLCTKVNHQKALEDLALLCEEIESKSSDDNSWRI